MKKYMFMIFMVLMTGVFATTIYIPGDYATIQDGINESEDGDEIIVSPGTYVENINFVGKAVILGSLFYTTQDTSYISQTIIDGNQNGSIVTFESEEDSNSILIGFTITNEQSDDGGGIYCDSYSPSIENVTITNNWANYAGGGINCDCSSLSLVNVTITGNSADYGGGIFCKWNSSPSLVNCIFWNNSPQEVEFHDSYEPNTITIAYSDIDEGEEGIVTNNNGTVYWLEGNIDADPLFFDIEMGNYHLTENSPCIDAGTSYFEYEGEVLVDLSEDEYWGIAPDMGSYEYGLVNTDEFKM